jgi:hypothetical protein
MTPKNIYKKIMSDKGNYSSRADLKLDAVSSDHPGYHERRSSTKAKDKGNRGESSVIKHFLLAPP